MNALILLGGLGSRLRPFTLNRPKPLMPILNRLFISYQLDQLKRHGIREVILALGHKAGHFRRHLGSGKRWGLRFRYSIEPSPLGTGGAIRQALPFIHGPTFILNGDVLSDIDLGHLAKAHHAARAEATLTLVAVDDPAAYGLVETDPEGKILRFLEKPSPDQITTRMINAGCYLFERSMIEWISPDGPVSVEREVFPQLLREGRRLFSYTHGGYWSDIGTLQSYWKTHMDLAGSAFDVSSSGSTSSKKRKAGESFTVVSGPGVKVGKNVVFSGKVVIGEGCRIGDHATIKDSVIQARSVIEKHSRVDSSLLGQRVRVRANASVGPRQVLGDKSDLSPYSQITLGLSPLS